MGTQKRDFNWKLDDVRQRILAAMLPEVAFDGWHDKAFQAAIAQADIDAAHAKLAFPKGAIDVAIYFHQYNDTLMAERLPERVAHITSFSQKIEAAIVLRIELADEHKEAVRAACALFALPQNAFISSKLIWGTADTIWRALGDQSTGFQYYSKRSSLSAVYSATVLYWLQDTSENLSATREFVSRRIVDVGNFGKFTARFKRKPA